MMGYKMPCEGCGGRMLVDVQVPDNLWAKIAPRQPCSPGGGGLLCAQCIDERLWVLGLIERVPIEIHLTGNVVMTISGETE